MLNTEKDEYTDKQTKLLERIKLKYSQ